MGMFLDSNASGSRITYVDTDHKTIIGRVSVDVRLIFQVHLVF